MRSRGVCNFYNFDRGKNMANFDDIFRVNYDQKSGRVFLETVFSRNSLNFFCAYS